MNNARESLSALFIARTAHIDAIASSAEERTHFYKHATAVWRDGLAAEACGDAEKLASCLEWFE